MKLSFSKIGDKPFSVALKKKRLLLEYDSFDVQLDGTVVLSREKRKDAVFLRGKISACYAGQCSRCARDLTCSFTCEFSYLLRVGSECQPDKADGECDKDTVELIYLEEPEIELDEILREQVYLNLPAQSLCSPSCKGICVGCKVDLNMEQCRCIEDQNSSAFAILRELTKQHN